MASVACGHVSLVCLPPAWTCSGHLQSTPSNTWLKSAGLPTTPASSGQEDVGVSAIATESGTVKLLNPRRGSGVDLKTWEHSFLPPYRNSSLLTQLNQGSGVHRHTRALINDKHNPSWPCRRPFPQTLTRKLSLTPGCRGACNANLRVSKLRPQRHLPK